MICSMLLHNKNFTITSLKIIYTITFSEKSGNDFMKETIRKTGDIFNFLTFLIDIHWYDLVPSSPYS